MIVWWRTPKEGHFQLHRFQKRNSSNAFVPDRNCLWRHKNLKGGCYELRKWRWQTPPELVMAHLNIDKATYDALPKTEAIVLPLS